LTEAFRPLALTKASLGRRRHGNEPPNARKSDEDTARIKSHTNRFGSPLDPEKSEEHLATTIGIKAIQSGTLRTCPLPGVRSNSYSVHAHQTTVKKKFRLVYG
jgi:hypothetical protein